MMEQDQHTYRWVTKMKLSIYFVMIIMVSSCVLADLIADSAEYTINEDDDQNVTFIFAWNTDGGNEIYSTSVASLVPYYLFPLGGVLSSTQGSPGTFLFNTGNILLDQPTLLLPVACVDEESSECTEVSLDNSWYYCARGVTIPFPEGQWVVQECNSDGCTSYASLSRNINCQYASPPYADMTDKIYECGENGCTGNIPEERTDLVWETYQSG
jgi:hypothetical protein